MKLAGFLSGKPSRPGERGGFTELLDGSSGIEFWDDLTEQLKTNG